MSQEQPQRPSAEPIKYGDVFNVSGELASKPVAPRDAAAMQSAETAVFGQTQKGGSAAVMQSAADVNESIGAVGHDDISDPASDRGVTVTQGVVDGRPVIAEAIGGQVVGGYIAAGGGGQGRRGGGQGGQGEALSDVAGQFETPSPTPDVGDKRSAIPDVGGITIGEALEATALMAGDRPIDTSDAAAIQAAEVRATGRGQVMPGGIGADAQSAAMTNPHLSDENKTKLGDVLKDASERLPRDKEVTRQDAMGIASAEVRNDPDMQPREAGVGRSMAAAARLNQGSGND